MDPLIAVPDHLPILSRGRQPPGSGAVCSEQAITWLMSGRIDLGDETDHPSCVQPTLNILSIFVNDSLTNARRPEMWPLLLRQPGTARTEMEPLLSIQMAEWCTGDQFSAAHGTTANARRLYEETKRFLVVAESQYTHQTVSNVAGAVSDAIRSAASAATHAALVGHSYAPDPALLDGADDRLLSLLAGAQDECERLAGHVPAGIDPGRIARLAELVGSAPP